MAILLIRHGETAGNRNRIIQVPETPLSEDGLAQAERLGRRLAVARRRFTARSGTYAGSRFLLGLFMGVAALVFLGCPFRMLQLLGGGDLNALLGLAGFVPGVLLGVVFERGGYRLGASAEVPAPVGLQGPAIAGILLALALSGALFGPVPGAAGPAGARTRALAPVAGIRIYALGTKANPIVTQSTPGLGLNKWGYIVADAATQATTLPGVFAGGDIVTGAATVILAMGAGRRAARAIGANLQGGKQKWPVTQEDADAFAPPLAIGATAPAAASPTITENEGQP